MRPAPLRIPLDDPIRRERYGTPVILTLRGTLAEREQIAAAAKSAGKSLNSFARARLGLDRPTAKPAPLPLFDNGGGI